MAQVSSQAKSEGGERDDVIRLAFQQGRADRIRDTQQKAHWNGHKIASDRYPTDDALFEAYMQGWDAAEGVRE